MRPEFVETAQKRGLFGSAVLAFSGTERPAKTSWLRQAFAMIDS